MRDVTEPLIALRLIGLHAEVLADLIEPTRLRGLYLAEVAADTGVLVCTVGPVRTVTVAKSDLALAEVIDELLPFGLGGFAIFG